VVRTGAQFYWLVPKDFGYIHEFTQADPLRLVLLERSFEKTVRKTLYHPLRNLVAIYSCKPLRHERRDECIARVGHCFRHGMFDCLCSFLVRQSDLRRLWLRDRRTLQRQSRSGRSH
jgi:hypothetical protein